MADTKISALSAATSLAGTDEFPLNQSGTSRKGSLDQAATYISAPIFACLQADYTLTSTTSAQQLFNVSANGAVTISTGLYWMEFDGIITGMSATSGNGAFQLGGTAVLANPRIIHSYGLDNSSLGTPAALQGAFVNAGTAFTTNTVTAATGTTMQFAVRGVFACTTGGTLIPQIALVTAAAAVVKAGSFFSLERVGAATDASRGTWS